jgi:glycosyltransferase involved in cell wall biosynthesis
MANHWAAAGHDVTVITLAADTIPPFYPLDPRVGLRPLGVTGRSPTSWHALLGNARRVLALRRAFREARPQVAIAFIDQTNVLALLAARGLGLPVVVAEHTDPALVPLGRRWRWLRRRTYPWARAIAVLNERARRFFADRPGARVAVIPNPVAVPPAARADAPPAASRAPTIVGMGRLGPEKRFDLLLSAFARLRSRHPAWRLVILGEGPARAALERQRDALGLAGVVELPGVLRDPYPVLRRAELFVLSSTLEGFPMALVEAMACGLPVIATEYHEGVREIVRDGIDGLVVPPGDPAALAAALDRLMADPAARGRLGARAAETAARFGVAPVMARWDALLDEVVVP